MIHFTRQCIHFTLVDSIYFAIMRREHNVILLLFISFEFRQIACIEHLQRLRREGIIAHLIEYLHEIYIALAEDMVQFDIYRIQLLKYMRLEEIRPSIIVL